MGAAEHGAQPASQGGGLSIATAGCATVESRAPLAKSEATLERGEHVRHDLICARAAAAASSSFSSAAAAAAAAASLGPRSRPVSVSARGQRQR